MISLCMILTVVAMTTPAMGNDDPNDQGRPTDTLRCQEDSVPALQEILDRYVEAVGGRAAVEKLTTRVWVGELVTDLPSRQPPVHESNGFTIYAKSPGKYLYLQRSAAGVRQDGFDGATCWSRGKAGIEVSVQCDRMLALLADPQSPLRLREYFPEMRVVGIRMLNGRPAYRVDIDERESHALYFDVGSGLLVRLGVFTELLEYREVDGVRVPFRVAISRKGGSSTYAFESVKHNVPIDDARFAVPTR